MSSATSFRGMFEATPFNHNIGGWPTGAALDFSFMFRQSSFNQNIGGWNLASAKTLTACFFQNTVFNQNIGNWNTASVTSFSRLFEGASSFDQNIGGWDVSNIPFAMTHGLFLMTWFEHSNIRTPVLSPQTASVQNMDGVFAKAVSFKQDISGWETGSATDMYQVGSYSKLFVFLHIIRATQSLTLYPDPVFVSPDIP